ncbi:hypothetical protein CY34DRAFT_109000 [Suillus luteus UH-Slu-Lm8-n1]|uniref:Uncharacterized protein n=1 Tax=Suillus luteus UH-Slu-Lm8-n1 TaxID=930992 RepID=A0A0D0B0V9_9AGAM|nr:hypothetical protein CY34DRAFT_109000 [Suillus luteus UH-Slu-Lm8-n1]
MWLMLPPSVQICHASSSTSLCWYTITVGCETGVFKAGTVFTLMFRHSSHAIADEVYTQALATGGVTQVLCPGVVAVPTMRHWKPSPECEKARKLSKHKHYAQHRGGVRVLQWLPSMLSLLWKTYGPELTLEVAEITMVVNLALSPFYKMWMNRAGVLSDLGSWVN